MDSNVAAPLGPDDPQEIGPFKIIGLLGLGGMGEVYLGTGETGYVAVKRVRPQVVVAERFKREIGILHRVPDGVAPSVWASDSTASRPWFATEYVPGLTVDEAVQLSGPLPPDALWLLLAELAAQLRVVHEAKIVHRDLKPANVMLVRECGVKLIDFGIARAADQAKLTRSGGGYGTRGFTAPEQDAGDPKVAAPADVYSLGALLLYAASGHTPNVTPDIEPVRAVEPELADVIESCLARDPAARPTAVDLVERSGDHVLATDPSWPQPVMQRIGVREEFASVPVGKTETIVPPGLIPVVPAIHPDAASSPAEQPRRRRALGVAALAAVAIVVGGTAAFVLAPSTPPTRTNTLSTGAPTLPVASVGATKGPASPILSRTASTASAKAASTSTNTADTTTDTGTAGWPSQATEGTGPAGGGAPNTSVRGPSGPSGDQYYISGSEITVPGCAGWVDFSGNIYATLSAGQAFCSANVITTNSNVGGDGTATLQTSDYNKTDSSAAFWYIGAYHFSRQICIWSQAAPAVKACSSTYTDNGGTVSKS